MSFVFRAKLFSSVVVASLLFTHRIYAQSLLYKVSGKDLKYSVYLFGTIHAIPQSDFFIDDVVIKKFEEAEKVYFEIDMDSPTMMMEVQTHMMMKGITIDQLMTGDDYQKLRHIMLDSLGLPLDFLKGVKPLLMSSFFLSKIVGPNSASYEAFLMAKAIEFEKEILGIETVAEQMAYVDSIPTKEQVKILMETVSDLNKSRSEFRKLIEVYSSRDVEKIYSYIIESSEEYHQFGNFLLAARNRNWVPRIISIANTHNAFFAVGAGHLGGPQGIVQLLRSLGYAVDIVK